MARKGKHVKKPTAGGTLKQENANGKQVASKDEKTKGKSHSNKEPVQGAVAKKQTSGGMAGFIFMCSGSTKSDCFKYRVFGLNEGKKNLVEQVRKGMRLFLFDIDLRLLYGIYAAASNGSYKVERDAFGGAFPWQVRFSIQKDCLPLPENVFQAAIKENYFDKSRFKVELSAEQLHRLVKLFRPLPGPVGRSPPRPRMSEEGAALKEKRYAASDRYLQERRRLSPRPIYETSLFSSDRERLPPISKHETSYTPSDRYRTERQIYGYAAYAPPEERLIPERRVSAYAPPEERLIPERRVSDDLYLGRELRLRQDVGSLAPAPAHSLAPLSLSAYRGTDFLRSLSDLRQPRVTDELYSVYPQGSTSALSSDTADPLYRQSLLSDVRTDMPDRRDLLDRRDVLDRSVAGLDPLRESSVAYSAYSGGLLSDLLRRRVSSDIYASTTGYGGLQRTENGAGLVSGGATGASGLAYRGDLLPQSRYYSGSGY